MSAAEPQDPARELELMTEFLYQLPVGVVRCTPDGMVELMNPPLARLMPRELGAWTSGNVFDLLERVFPDLQTLIDAHPGPGTVFQSKRVPVPTPAGTAMTWLSFTANRLAAGRFALTVADVSAEVEREQQLRQASAWITALIQGTSAHMACRLDHLGRVSEWTEGARRLTGWSAPQVLGTHVESLFVAERGMLEHMEARLRRAAAAGWDLDEGMMRRRDAPPWFATSLITTLDIDSAMHRYGLVVRDMSDRREAAEALRRLTVHDQLTGAFNRAYLFTAGEQEFAATRLAGRPVSAIVLDIDLFKAINDSHGHGAGDAALAWVTGLCQRQLRAADLLARTGGEEFCVLLPNCAAPAAMQAAERMRAAIAAEPLAHGELRIDLTASFGVADTGTAGAQSLAGLIAAADRALYEAKTAGRNRVRCAAA